MVSFFYPVPPEANRTIFTNGRHAAESMDSKKRRGGNPCCFETVSDKVLVHPFASNGLPFWDGGAIRDLA